MVFCTVPNDRSSPLPRVIRVKLFLHLFCRRTLRKNQVHSNSVECVFYYTCQKHINSSHVSGHPPISRGRRKRGRSRSEGKSGATKY